MVMGYLGSKLASSSGVLSDSDSLDAGLAGVPDVVTGAGAFCVAVATSEAVTGAVVSAQAGARVRVSKRKAGERCKFMVVVCDGVSGCF